MSTEPKEHRPPIAASRTAPSSDVRCPTADAQPLPTRRILGVDYFVGTIEQAVAKTVSGGLVLAPSGPGMTVDIVNSKEYREAVQNADLAITDSGYMILLWRLLTGERLPRLSGLRFIHALLREPAMKEPGASFWVMPNQAESDRNVAWLNAHGFSVTNDDIYLAPFYGSARIDDPELVTRIEDRRPLLVMLCIGGGIQERVGLYLKRRLSYLPGIPCLGAAIAFVTGGQANIPPWADRLMLGWLLRTLSNPKKFGKRYWNSIGLARLLYRHRERMPPLRSR